MTQPGVTQPGIVEPADEALPWFARRVPFAWILLVTAGIGWLAAGILVLERLKLYVNPDYTTSCDINPWISCGAVMETHQAELFGFPNPLLGIVAFVVVITTAMAVLGRARMRRWYWVGLQVGVTLGFIFIVWLWSQALFAIDLLCIYCMVVWAMMIPMFVLLTIRNLLHGVLPAPRGVTLFLSNWAWLIVALLWIATAASVFFRFMGAFIGN